MAGDNFNVTVSEGGTTVCFVDFDFYNSGDGTYSGSNVGIDVATNNPSDVLTQMVSALTGASFPGPVSCETDSFSLTMETSTPGAGEQITTVYTGSQSALPSSTSTGTNDVPAHGGTPEVELIPSVAGKKIKSVHLSLTQSGTPLCTCLFSLKSGGIYTDIARVVSGVSQVASPISGAEACFAVGQNAGESLVLRYTEDPGVGSAAVGLAIVEQQ